MGTQQGLRGQSGLCRGVSEGTVGGRVGGGGGGSVAARCNRDGSAQHSPMPKRRAAVPRQ